MLAVKNYRNSPWTTLLMSFGAILLVFCIVLYPDQAFQASLQGLSIWWKLIFPALLPFLVLSEMLIAFGAVHALGVILDPFMRRIFGIPGIGGWAMSLGWTAGYPAGAGAIAKLRRQKAIRRHEAQILLALSHVSNPVFIIVVVGVGFLQRPELGILLAIIHWASALCTGLFMRWLTPRSDKLASSKAQEKTGGIPEEPDFIMLPGEGMSRSRIKRIAEAMHNAHQQDGRSFGKLLGEAVSSAVQTLMMIGGYIMIFSVIIQVVRLLIPQQIAGYMVNGFFEVNLGTHAVSTAAFASEVWQMALLGVVLAWSGISAHLQVRTLLKGTDLGYGSFIGSRLLHSSLAFALTYLLWNPLHLLLGRIIGTAPVFTQSETPAIHPLPEWLFRFQGWTGWFPLSLWLALLLSLMAFASGLIAIRQRRRN